MDLNVVREPMTDFADYELVWKIKEVISNKLIEKNSYLQLVCAINPKIINRAVNHALQGHPRKGSEWTKECHLVSMQPSLYAPHVDITRANIGFGRVGLRILNRDLHSKDHLLQLQALHSIMDRVQISEDALFLISLNVVHRLMMIMNHPEPVVREKVCLTLTHLARYYQGKQRILKENKIMNSLLTFVKRDINEIRYAAANTIKELAKDRRDAEKLCQMPDLIENLIAVARSDYKSIILLVLEILEILIEYNVETALRANAFQVFLELCNRDENKVLAAALDCLSQLCKHPVGLMLADENDITINFREFLRSSKTKVIIAALGLMMYTTLTLRAKWRVREYSNETIKRLVLLARRTVRPILQLRALQCLINLCDLPDLRNRVREHWEYEIQDIKIQSPEQWDGHTKITRFGYEFSHNYRSVYVENKETLCNDVGDFEDSVNVHTYLNQIVESKKRLITVMYKKPYP